VTEGPSSDLYSQIASYNVLELCKPLLDQGWHLGTDGKLRATTRLATNIPWVFAVQDETRKCSLWHSIFFGVLGMLPSPCLGCWKVVVRPKTLADLFELHEIQKEMGIPSKCGIEVREQVHGLYGGYFYNDSPEQGQRVYEQVRDAVGERLAPDTKVILKRGCTEFEIKFGDSSQWDSLITDYQLEIETKLDCFIETRERIEQQESIRKSIFKRWIEWAHASGDETYLQFTDGRLLYPSVTTYHKDG